MSAGGDGGTKTALTGRNEDRWGQEVSCRSEREPNLVILDQYRPTGATAICSPLSGFKFGVMLRVQGTRGCVKVKASKVHARLKVMAHVYNS